MTEYVIQVLNDRVETDTHSLSTISHCMYGHITLCRVSENPCRRMVREY